MSLTDNRDSDRPDDKSVTEDGADVDVPRPRAAGVRPSPSAEVASARPTDDDYVDL